MQRHDLNDRQLSEIAWMYYVADMTQAEIGKRLGVSRPTVMAYLKEARDRKIFEVRLKPHHFRLHELAQQLRERFGLEEAYVAGAPEGAAKRAILEEVCRAAGWIVSDRARAGDRLGISWGETIWLVSQEMPFHGVDDIIVRQLIGSMSNPVIQSAELCTTEIARRLSATAVNLNAPAICSNSSLARGLRREPIIAEQLDQLKACNKALFSLSPCNLSTHVYKFRVCTEDHISEYAARGAVGIIAGRFFDSEGKPVLGALDEQLIGIALDDLKTIGERTLVVSGSEKLEPTAAALRGGLITHLIADQTFAERLLAMPSSG